MAITRGVKGFNSKIVNFPFYTNSQSNSILIIFNYCISTFKPHTPSVFSVIGKQQVM